MAGVRPALLERAPCPWCGAEVVSERGDGSGFRVQECGSCGIGVTRPVPSDAELDAAYGDWYRPEEGRFSGPGDRILRWSRSALARHLDRAAPAGRILDVGAGDGTLVAALRARGRDALGLERHASGAYIEDKEVADVGGEWAAVVFWHSLEHLPEPGQALADAASRLKGGGILIVAVPDYRSLQASVFGKRWFALDLPRHLVHLDAAHLAARMEQLGLQVVRRSSLRGGQVLFGWLDGLVKCAPGDLDLYAAVRRPSARDAALTRGRRVASLAAALLLSPVALLASLIEVVLGRGGSAYLEAQAPPGATPA